MFRDLMLWYGSRSALPHVGQHAGITSTSTYSLFRLRGVALTFFDRVLLAIDSTRQRRDLPFLAGVFLFDWLLSLNVNSDAFKTCKTAVRDEVIPVFVFCP